MKKSRILAISAVFTAIFSTLCCLPALIFVIFGVSSGVLAFFVQFESIRWILAGISVVLLISSIRTKSCACDKNALIGRYASFGLLFVVILILLFYPEIVPLFLEE